MAEMSISFTTKTSMTNIAHNNRELTEEEYKEPAHNHIIRELTPENIIIKQEDIHEVYEKEFGQALQDYNAKQKRADRKIKDYYQHVGHSKTLDRQREFVVTLGSKDDWEKLSREEKHQAGEKLAEYVREFEVRHPQLKVYNAVVHLDEKGAPHTHFNIVPVATGYQKGLAKQPSFSKALEQEGFGGKSKYQFQEFRNTELKELEHKLKDLHIERKLVGTNTIKDMHEYKKLVGEYKEFEREIAQNAKKEAQEVEKLKRQINTLESQKNVLESKIGGLQNELEKTEVAMARQKAFDQLEFDVLSDLGMESTLKNFDLEKNDISFGRNGLFGKQIYAFVPKEKFEKIIRFVNDRPFVKAKNTFQDLTNNLVQKFRQEIDRLQNIIKTKNIVITNQQEELTEKDQEISQLKQEIQTMIPHYNDSIINHEILQDLGYDEGFDDAVAELVQLRFEKEQGKQISFSEAKQSVQEVVKERSQEHGIKPPLRDYTPPKPKNRKKDRGYQGPTL